MASAVETLIRGAVTKGIIGVANVRRSLKDSSAEHPFLTGIHAPIHDELTIDSLKVTGTIPEALSGRYVRIGPNPFKPDPRGHHWFIGDGMVHGIRIQNGRALWYKNRWIRSRRVAQLLGGAQIGRRVFDHDAA